jgi:hypothetical protein
VIERIDRHGIEKSTFAPGFLFVEGRTLNDAIAVLRGDAVTFFNYMMVQGAEGRQKIWTCQRPVHHG